MSHRVMVRDSRVQAYMEYADSFPKRLMGLMGRPLRHDGLLLRPCASIHTFFMRQPIDVLFLDAQGVVLRVCPHTFPWSVRLGPRGTYQVLEMAPGAAQSHGWAPGHKLHVAVSG